MADNFTTPVPDGTVLATKQVAGAHFPKNVIAKWDGTDADLATQTTLAAINTKLAASVAVTGAFWQATQPVSLASLPALAAGSNLIGGMNVSQLGGTAVSTNTGNAGAGVQRVVLATDQPAPLNPVRGMNVIQPADGGFTFPSGAAYAIGDLIANHATAGSVTPTSFTGATLTGSGGSGRIADLVISKAGTGAARVRAHFLKTSHAVTNGDNGALVFTSLDLDSYIGFLDVSFTGTDDAIGASGTTLVAKTCDPPLDYVLASGDTIFVFLQALTAFTPTNGGDVRIRPTFEVVS